MKLLAFSALSTLLILAEAQQLIDLKSLKSGNTPLKSDTFPYSIYVSATSDSDDLLKQIYVVTNQSTPLTKLKHNMLYQNSLLLEPFRIDGDAYLTTSLPDTDIQKLSGFLYVTTAKQLADQRFFVYNVGESQNIHFGKFRDGNKTAVLLNSNFDKTPYQSAIISDWSQTEWPVYIYEGVPKDEAPKPNSFIFSNPVMTTAQKVPISNVETFSLSLGTFYVTSESGVDFSIRSGYANVDNTKTTATTTTGLYMKTYNSPDSKITIQTIRNSKANGVFGANVIGSVPEAANVTISEIDGTNSFSNTLKVVDEIRVMKIDAIGQSITIESSGAVAGEFFVQYYVIATEEATSTTLSNRQTTSRVQTTTSSSTITRWLISALLPIIGTRFL